MMLIMYLSQFALVRYLLFCFLLQMVAFIAILSADKDISGLDEQIAFGVGQHNIPVGSPNAKSEVQEIEGYVGYCPCMGRFGNQADQFLGALAFAKGLNRTLILPPWIVYPQYSPGGSVRVPFDSWFQVQPLQKYHRVVTMETFMKKLAPSVWPPGKRIGFCYSYRGSNECSMKDGNPFGPFWDHFKINFDGYREHSGILWGTEDLWTRDQWNTRFPTSEYPVIALMGAPGSFPCEEHNKWLQKFVKWSTQIDKKAKKFISAVLPKGPFVGIHLRNGIDFKNACEHVKDTNSLFASPQCIRPGSNKKLTYDICFPPEKDVIKRTKKMVKKIKAKSVFVATDSNPLMEKLTKAMKKLEVTVHVHPPEDEMSDPIVDLAILSQADHFIGNCVSSFTAFAKRMRDTEGKPTSFWAYDD